MSTSQIFKSKVPNETLFIFLNEVCIKNEKCYVFNNNSYKKAIFMGLIDNFLNDCKQYYHLSKQKYLEKKMKYNNFTTIIRQICNCNQITYTSKIVYDKSTYDINYYIYFA